MSRLLFANFFVLLLTSAAAPFDFTDSPFEIPEPSGQPLTLMFTGDTKLEGRTLRAIERHGIGYPLRLVADELRSADLAFTNCETAITDYTRLSPGKPLAAVQSGRAFAFKAPPKIAREVFADAGLDIVQLANNHAMDYCAQGLLDTFDTLDSAGIAHVGAGRNYAEARAARVVETGGWRIGFLAYSMIVPLHSAARQDSPGINFLPVDYARVLKRDLEALRAEADLIVVGIHWGQEGATQPSAAQRKVGRAAIDLGADLVIGTHTHSFQGIEHYQHGLIAYSLGNFVFTGASPLLAGGVLRIRVEPDGDRMRISQAALLPCWIRDGVPTPSIDSKLHRQLSAILTATDSRLRAADGQWLAIEPRK